MNRARHLALRINEVARLYKGSFSPQDEKSLKSIKESLQRLAHVLTTKDLQVMKSLIDDIEDVVKIASHTKKLADGIKDKNDADANTSGPDLVESKEVN